MGMREEVSQPRCDHGGMQQIMESPHKSNENIINIIITSNFLIAVTPILF